VAGKLGHIGWHTFRHTYGSWLDDTGVPIAVQQKLMRHAQVSTTMNVYGNALMESKRATNTAVVKGGVKPVQCGGVKVGQWTGMKLLSISWGRASGA